MNIRRMTRSSAFLAAAGVAVVALAGVLTSTVSASAAPIQRNESPSVKPTVVLVHGAFADASGSWDGVIKRLQKQGYPVMAPANPLRGPSADSAYLASILDSIKGPIVLVGHSYGGAVITNAAANDPDVKALVYIDAFMPDKGETVGELSAKYPGSEIQAALNPVPFPSSDGTTGTDLYLQADKLRAVFAADLPESTTRLMAATQRPISVSSFSDLTQDAAWRTIPSSVLIGADDKVIPAELQRFQAERAGSRIVEVAASHVAMISQPDIATKVIIDAANATA